MIPNHVSKHPQVVLVSGQRVLHSTLIDQHAIAHLLQRSLIPTHSRDKKLESTASSFAYRMYDS